MRYYLFSSSFRASCAALWQSFINGPCFSTARMHTGDDACRAVNAGCRGGNFGSCSFSSPHPSLIAVVLPARLPRPVACFSSVRPPHPLSLTISLLQILQVGLVCVRACVMVVIAEPLPFALFFFPFLLTRVALSVHLLLGEGASAGAS